MPWCGSGGCSVDCCRAWVSLLKALAVLQQETMQTLLAEPMARLCVYWRTCIATNTAAAATATTCYDC